MKKGNRIAVIIVAVLIFGGLAYGGKGKYPRNLDGNDWARFSQSHKIGFLSGFYAIHDISMRKAKEINNFIDYILPQLCPEKFESEKQTLLWLQFKFHFPVEEFELDQTTPQQILDGLEAFYKDHRNLNIKIVNGVYIVREGIRGKDPDYVEAWTRWLRKPKRERIKLSRQWRIKGARGLSPNSYRAKDGTVYMLFDYVPFD
jgi:hypothetical protein